MFWILFRKNCIFTHDWILYASVKHFPLLLPSHNCIIITMFSFQGAYLNLLERNSVKFLLSRRNFNQFLFWWRLAGSNRWPPACKAGALPAELNPHLFPSLLKKWWAKMDSNHRPHDYQSCALASWAIGPYLASTSSLGTYLLYPLNWITLRFTEHFLYWP